MRMLRAIALVVGTGLLAPAAGAQAPAASPSAPPPPPLAAEELVKRVDAFVRPFVEDGHLSAAASMVELARCRTLQFVPGARSSYSSAGYSVLTRVLELASGASYPQLLAERILKPAGLTATAQASSRDLLPDRAPSYVAAPDGPRHAEAKDLSFLVGAGSLYSTPRDLFRLLTAARAGALGEAARQSVVARPRVAWNGNTNGYRAFVDSDPATGVTVIVASNLMTGALDRLQSDLPRLAAGEVLPLPARLAVRPVALDPAILARYAGSYELNPGTPFKVTVQGDTLDTGGRILVPTSPTTFFSYADYGTVTVVLRPDGTVERLDWSLPGGRMLAMPRL